MQKLTKFPYKASNGIWLTEAIFWERANDKPVSQRTHEPIFSLYDDKPGLVNCRTTFVNFKDPTGRKWALTYLGDWNHWTRLMRCKWFREAYDSWIMELNAQLKSEALSKVMEIMQGENSAQALAAAKYIASAEYDKVGRGRPSKSEMEGELKRAAEAVAVEDEDLARIGLTVINGGKSG